MLPPLRRLLFGPGSAGERAASKVDWNPDWLGHRLMADELPWDQAEKIAMDVFLQSHSLHDSYWTGLWLTPGQGLVAIIRWEVLPTAFDNPEWRTFAERAGPYPVLALCFPQVYRLDQEVPVAALDPSLYGTIVRADSRQLPEAEVHTVLWPPDEEREYEREGRVCETTIWGIDGYRLRFLHGLTVSVLLFDEAGAPMPLSGVGG